MLMSMAMENLFIKCFQIQFPIRFIHPHHINNPLEDSYCLVEIQIFFLNCEFAQALTKN